MKDTKTPTPSKTSKAGRWAHLNGFVDFTLRSLRPAEVRVWLVLFRDCKPDGKSRAGQTDIARRAGLSVRQVKRALKRLVEVGLAKVLIRGRLNKGVTVYKVRGVNPSG